MKKKNCCMLFALGCVLVLLPLAFAGPALAQCTMSTQGLDAALGQCQGDDPGCYAEIAAKVPTCAGNILWLYMILYTPDELTQVQVLKLFKAEIPGGQVDPRLLDAVATEAKQVIQNQENAGNRDAYNEYPFGQGTPYGQ